MKNILKQGVAFLGISGLGWLIDFAVYSVLTSVFLFSVMRANMASAVPAITFVFFSATYKTFQNRPGSLSLGYKYLLYFGYQVCLVSGVSWIGQWLFNSIYAHNSFHLALMAAHLHLAVKFMITPITLIANFLVMKLLIERI